MHALITYEDAFSFCFTVVGVEMKVVFTILSLKVATTHLREDCEEIKCIYVIL